MSLSPVTLGDIALTAVAVAFAYLVYRLSRVVGKAEQILEETRVGVRGVSDQTVPLIGEVTSTVAATNQQLARVDSITTNVATMATNASALTSLFAATLGSPLVKVAAFTYGVRSAMAGGLHRRRGGDRRSQR